MTANTELQNLYMKLYHQVRKFIWDVEVVTCLANLEVSIFNAFPDISEARRNFHRFRSKVSFMEREDEELRQCLNDLQSKLDDLKEVYAKLDQVQEVVSR